MPGAKIICESGWYQTILVGIAYSLLNSKVCAEFNSICHVLTGEVNINDMAGRTTLGELANRICQIPLFSLPERCLKYQGGDWYLMQLVQEGVLF